MREFDQVALIANTHFVVLLLGLALPNVSAAAGVQPAAARARSVRQSQADLPLEFDHVMIHVAPGAPERTALEHVGFRIAPDINQHEGQGSASITVELENCFLELVWRDDSVSVEPALEKIARRFERQGHWRTSGWSPFGIGLRRSSSGPDSLPFPTRAVSSPWMEPGAKIEIVSAAEDTLGPRIFVVPRVMAANGQPDSESERRRLSQPETFLHANGSRRVTRVRVLAPARALTPATQLAARFSPVVFASASGWLLDVTFDGGRKGITRDLRPALPMIVHL
jgi:hypothetical protein